MSGHALIATHREAAAYRELSVWAKMLDDAMKARIACANRIERGGVDPLPYQAQLGALKTAEQGVSLAMRRCYRRVVDPGIVAWQRATLGIGEHLLARLLGVIGHPRYTMHHHWEGSGAERVLVCDGEMERRVSDLWSYCGAGDPKRRRRSGMSAEEACALGSPEAKMLIHLIAECCVKERRSPYRTVYDAAREKYADRLHTEPCAQCGAKGKPAVGGTPWRDGHKHGAALRLVAKTILKDLWIVAGQMSFETHRKPASDTENIALAAKVG